jgi:response regulator NasT
MTRVLIADDESIIRMDLRESLTSLGYDVIADAPDGVQALQMARELRPDMVIMDIKMPGMDGIEAARRLNEERVAPVVLLTAYNGDDLIEGAVQAGVAGYIVKPIQESELRPAIDVALARHRDLVRATERAEDAEETLETRKLVDRAKGLLMDTENLKEAEAFRKIQKLSMNTRKSMKEIAQAIILTHEVKQQS